MVEVAIWILGTFIALFLVSEAIKFYKNCIRPRQARPQLPGESTYAYRTYVNTVPQAESGRWSSHGSGSSQSIPRSDASTAPVIHNTTIIHEHPQRSDGLETLAGAVLVDSMLRRERQDRYDDWAPSRRHRDDTSYRDDGEWDDDLKPGVSVAAPMTELDDSPTAGQEDDAPADSAEVVQADSAVDVDDSAESEDSGEVEYQSSSGNDSASYSDSDNREDSDEDVSYDSGDDSSSDSSSDDSYSGDSSSSDD